MSKYTELVTNEKFIGNWHVLFSISEKVKPHILIEKQVTNWITLKYCWSSSSSHVLQFSLYPIRIMFGRSLPSPVISINPWHPASKLSFSVILKNAFTLCRISHWYAFLVRATWTLCEWLPCEETHNTLVKRTVKMLSNLVGCYALCLLINSYRWSFEMVQ
jgi:hypothetical protein